MGCLTHDRYDSRCHRCNPEDTTVSESPSVTGSEACFDGAHDALNRMRRAQVRGTGCHLTADMIQSLYISFLGEVWGEDDPREKP